MMPDFWLYHLGCPQLPPIHPNAASIPSIPSHFLLEGRSDASPSKVTHPERAPNYEDSPGQRPQGTSSRTKIHGDAAAHEAERKRKREQT